MDVTQEIRDGIIKTLLQKSKGTSQLPVYKQACNLLYVLTQIINSMPRKLYKYSDGILGDSREVLKAISLANELPLSERYYYVQVAKANVTIIRSDIVILRKLGIISVQLLDRLNTLTRNIIAQLAGWSNSLKREGQ